MVLLTTRKGGGMDDKRWEKLAAGTGVAFVVLLLASAFVVPNTPPKINDSIEKIGTFYAKHHNGLVWGGWFGLVATLFGLWFIGTVAHWVRRQDQPRLATIAFGGGVTATGVALAGGMFSLTLAYMANNGADLSPATGRMLFDLGLIAYSFIWIPIAVLVAAVSMAGMRSKVMPQWLWGSGAVYSVLAVIVSAGVFAHSGAFAPGGAIQYIAFLVFLVWTLALSLWLWSKVGEGAPAAASAERMAVSS